MAAASIPVPNRKKLRFVHRIEVVTLVLFGGLCCQPANAYFGIGVASVHHRGSLVSIGHGTEGRFYFGAQHEKFNVGVLLRAGGYSSGFGLFGGGGFGFWDWGPIDPLQYLRTRTRLLATYQTLRAAQGRIDEGFSVELYQGVSVGLKKVTYVQFDVGVAAGISSYAKRGLGPYFLAELTIAFSGADWSRPP